MIDDRYFDKDGKPMDMMDWAMKMEDFDYKVIKQEYTPGDCYWVSTVWLGLNHSFGDGPPLIFETMVFEGFERHRKGRPASGDWSAIPAYNYREEVDMNRYSTLSEAEAGHAELLKKWTNQSTIFRKIFTSLRKSSIVTKLASLI